MAHTLSTRFNSQDTKSSRSKNQLYCKIALCLVEAARLPLRIGEIPSLDVLGCARLMLT
jgi:hypothetical protein